MLEDHSLFIGAEVFIEPGQTAEQVDTWFLRMRQCGMKVARIRLFEIYMRKEDGTWDYTLFDRAFAAAAKYGIRVYGNLFPCTSFTDVGGFKFPADDQHLIRIAAYIQQVVSHFKTAPALCGWVPLNEPGSASLPDTAFTHQKFLEWKAELPPGQYNSKGYTGFDFKPQKFLVYYTTWFLDWLTQEIRKHDREHAIHVNNHALFQHVAAYDFPGWTRFLDSLGGSAHISWHFSYFRRDQYALGMSAKSEIIRSGAGTLPWFMTELQGGNTLYSSFQPACPTKEEIIQWVWIILATGGRGALFWCLNARGSGLEAGEWAMLDFQNEPTDRLQAAAEVATAISLHRELLSTAIPVDPGFSVIYIREAIWIEKAMQVTGTRYEGREEGGVMKSALGWFEALSTMGIPAAFKEIGEFDFDKDDFTGQVMILAHQVSIPSRYWPAIAAFVRLGGELIVDGLTGLYDENGHCVMLSGFPLQDVFGGVIREFKLVDDLFSIPVDDPLISLPAHLWRGTILPTTARPAAQQDGAVLASRNRYGKGGVLWIPSLVGLGSRITRDYPAMVKLLRHETAATISRLPYTFSDCCPGVLMKILAIENGFITVLVNKSGVQCSIDLVSADQALLPALLFAGSHGKVAPGNVLIGAEETLVIQWS